MVAMQNARKILLTLFVTTMLLGLIEGCAWIYVVSQPNIYQGDLGYFWSLRPNIEEQIVKEEYSFQLKTNSDGLRDEELSSEAARWLFLGCSTTLGWGVEASEGFVDLLDNQLDSAQLINGGQPGWTTQQGLMGIDQFKTLQPQHVFLGFGVRDAQFSYREDREARPSPWIVSLNTMKLMAKMLPKKEQTGEKRRVSIEHFERNLKLLRKSFPQAKVHLYVFPQLSREMEYEEVVRRLGGSVPTGFHGGDFFDKDTIHLNPAGHQKLARWFRERFLPSLGLESKPPSTERKE